jgi:hypothetical protein
METFVIASDGKLICKRWNQEIKQIEHIDATNAFIAVLGAECKIDENVTFKDILLLINKINAYPLLSPLLTGNIWLKDIVNEGLDSSLPHETNIDTMYVGWRASVTDDVYDNKNCKRLFVDPDLYGTGLDPLDKYSLDLTPTNELINCKIKLDTSFKISDETSVALEHIKAQEDIQSLPICLEARKDFTLLDILRGIFWELSFHGGPEERNARRKKLEESIRRLDSGEDTAISFEELKQKMDYNREDKK